MRGNENLAAEVIRGNVRPVRLFPDPVLKEQCEKVREVTAEAVGLLDDLLETMLSLPRCVGLAAPQIGVALRAIVVDVSRNPRAKSRNHGLLCMFNPLVRFSAGLVTSREGCVSVPEFTANVTRAEHIIVDYVDYGGTERALEASGFEAVALQHEIDHLDGKLFLDRVTSADVFRRKSRDK